MTPAALSAEELLSAWPLLAQDDRLEGFSMLSRADAEEVFLNLEPWDQAGLLATLSIPERRLWLRLLPPDDAADVIQETEGDERVKLLDLLDGPTRKEVVALLAYAEDEAGGLMTPLFARLRPDMTVDEALTYLRRQTQHIENIYYPYVLDNKQKLIGVVSLRQIVSAKGSRKVSEIMNPDVISVPEGLDQEQVARRFAEHDLTVIPVVDEDGHMKGIVTVDDVVDVFQEEATEDIQKLGGTEALEEPYISIKLADMLRKRVGWLASLLLLGFLAVLAIKRFDAQLEAAKVLAFFMPLIISSGGNSGSQAATLVVRAMALNEVRLRDWFRVARREVLVGVGLGAALGIIGFAIVLLWHFVMYSMGFEAPFGEHFFLLGATVAASIVAVALWGTIAGSMLPFGLRALGWDPASASAPLVATIVDASGLVIYFSIASIVLVGTLL